MKRLLFSAVALAILATVLLTVPVSADPDDKVWLCHYPPGNPENVQLLNISDSAVPAHVQNHPGDFVEVDGPFPCPCVCQ